MADQAGRARLESSRMDALATSRRRFARGIAAAFLVRFHMSIIFVAVVATAVAASRLLFLAGIDSLMVRYALAATAAYAVFFVFVRVWIFYVTLAGSRRSSVDLPDVVWPGRGGSNATFEPGGGHFGGGGASGSFDPEAVNAGSVLEAAPSGGSGGGGGLGADVGLDADDAVLLLLALLALATCLAGAAIYLVWQAPVILPDAAFEALLASGLVTASTTERQKARGWARGLLRSTVVPFALVLLAAMFVGWAAHRYCPPAKRLLDVPRLCR